MDHQRWRLWQFGNAVERRLQRRFRVRVRLLVEADVTVADLDKGEPVRRRGVRGIGEVKSPRHPADNAPHNAGAGPSHAFEQPARFGFTSRSSVIAPSLSLTVERKA